MPTQLTEEVVVEANPDVVWALIGRPESIADWHPGIAASPVTDGVRYCSLEGGGEVDEPIESHSDAERTYTYSIARSPFEMSGYRSTLTVSPVDGGSRVVWTGEFEAPDEEAAAALATAFAGVYRAGLDRVTELTAG